MPSLGWFATVAVSLTIGALCVGIRRNRHDAALIDAMTPVCPHCRDTGAHVTKELRPRVQFCNLCPLGQMFEQQASARIDWARTVRRSIDLPDGA